MKMTTKSRLNVEVGDTETEIIESTETVSSEERKFGVGNGEKEIIATAWGSDDNQNWHEEDSATIGPGRYKILIVGPSHDPWVKLTARTSGSGETSIVDGYLTYTAA
jgi:hypothetical protein